MIEVCRHKKGDMVYAMDIVFEKTILLEVHYDQTDGHWRYNGYTHNLISKDFKSFKKLVLDSVNKRLDFMEKGL